MGVKGALKNSHCVVSAKGFISLVSSWRTGRPLFLLSCVFRCLLPPSRWCRFSVLSLLPVVPLVLRHYTYMDIFEFMSELHKRNNLIIHVRRAQRPCISQKEKGRNCVCLDCSLESSTWVPSPARRSSCLRRVRLRKIDTLGKPSQQQTRRGDKW